MQAVAEEQSRQPGIALQTHCDLGVATRWSLQRKHCVAVVQMLQPATEQLATEQAPLTTVDPALQKRLFALSMLREVKLVEVGTSRKASMSAT